MKIPLIMTYITLIAQGVARYVMGNAQSCSDKLEETIVTNASRAVPRIPTEVGLQAVIYSILEVNEIKGTFTAFLWLRQRYELGGVRWKPPLQCNITSLPIHNFEKRIFAPDIRVYNRVNRDDESCCSVPKAIVFFDGTVLFSKPMQVEATCAASANERRPGGN